MVDIQKYASVIAEGHSAGTSSKFAFIPTTRVIDILKDQGWFPNKISEKNARKDTTKGFQTHLVRFRQPEQMNVVRSVGDLLPEIVLKNAHDGTAAFTLMAGIFRLVCSNGSIVADSMFQSHKIRHIGFQDQNVIDAVFSVVETTPRIMSRVSDFKQIELDKPEQVALGEMAIMAKYGDKPGVTELYDPERLVSPTRRSDRIDVGDYQASRNTLWNTYQIIQEKLIEKGGKFSTKQTNTGRQKVRGIRDINESVRLNQCLWALTEKMAELKGRSV
jgi:hypothetical protein